MTSRLDQIKLYHQGGRREATLKQIKLKVLCAIAGQRRPLLFTAMLKDHMQHRAGKFKQDVQLSRQKDQGSVKKDESPQLLLCCQSYHVFEEL